MGLFKRNDQQKPVLDSNQEEVAGRIASAMLAAQRRSAEWLNAKASKMQRMYIVILMGVLGLGFGFWCLYLVVGVLF